MPSYVGFKAWDMGFDAHMTVCYFGDEATEETLAKIQKIVEDPYWQGPAFATRKGFELFGPDNDIPVATLSVPVGMHHLREELQQFSVSQFTDWKPHITLDLEAPEIRIPQVIRLDFLGVY